MRIGVLPDPGGAGIDGAFAVGAGSLRQVIRRWEDEVGERPAGACTGWRPGGCAAASGHMEDDAVVAGIAVVPVQMPLRWRSVDLDIAAECRCADADDSIEKIRTGVGVGGAGVDHPDPASVGGAQVRCEQIVSLPDPVEGRFREVGHLAETFLAVAVDLVAKRVGCRARRIGEVLTRGGEQNAP